MLQRASAAGSGTATTSAALHSAVSTQMYRRGELLLMSRLIVVFEISADIQLGGAHLVIDVEVG